MAGLDKLAHAAAGGVALAAKAFPDPMKGDRRLIGARRVKHDGIDANRPVAEPLVVQDVNRQPYEALPHGSPLRSLLEGASRTKLEQMSIGFRPAVAPTDRGVGRDERIGQGVAVDEDQAVANLGAHSTGARLSEYMPVWSFRSMVSATSVPRRSTS